MSIEAPNWYVTQYKKTAIHKLQSKGFLTRGMAEMPDSVVGNIARFFIMGKGKAVPRAIVPEPVKPMNLGKGFVDLTMSDWQAAEYVPHGEPEKMSVNLKDKVAEAGAMAMGRRFDKLLFESLDAEGANIQMFGGAGGIVPDPAIFMDAKGSIAALGAAELNQYWLPLPQRAFDQLKLWKVFNSAEYVGPDLQFLKQTEAKTWNNTNYFVMPGGFDSGGVLLEDSVFSSPAAGVIDTYVWHRSALGFGSNYDMNAVVTYENIMTSWLYNNTMNAGWKTLLPEGIKRIRLVINAPLDTSHA